MMERLNDIMGRAVQRRPVHYGYSDQQRVTQSIQRPQGTQGTQGTQGQPERHPSPASTEAVTRNLQQEPRTYSAHNAPRQSHPLPEQMGRGGYSSRSNTTNSGNSAGQTGRIESSERLGRLPASQPSIPPIPRSAQNTQVRPSNAPGNYYGRERHSIPAVSRQPQANPSSISEMHTYRPTSQGYNDNTQTTGNTENGNIRAYQPQRSLTPSQQDAAYHPLKTRPVAVQFPTEDYTVSPRTRSDAIDTWEGEERATGMQYGDWEEDEQEIVVYQRPTTVYQEADTYIVQQQEQAYSSYPQNLQHPHVTRNLHEVRIQEVAAAYPMHQMHQMHPASNPAIEPAGEQYHRMTQPLDPRRVQNYEDGERLRQRPTTSEYGNAASYDNYRTPQDVPTPLSAQRRPIRSLSQVKSQPEEMASISAPGTATNMLAPVSQSTKSVCPKCHGAGYLRADVPFGHPNFGKPIACECKEAERKEKRRQQLRDMSNMDAFRDSTFRTFNPRIPGVQEAYQVTHEFAQDPDGWLLLIGPNGCGKTHLAAAIANQSLDSGSVVLFAVVPDLLDHLRAAFAPTAKEMYDQLFSKMREAELLVLDDLGSQQSSPWANEKLFQLLNYRYNLGMPTVITANPKGLQGVDERIRSRLCDVSLVSTVIMDRARDYRPTHPRREV